MGTQSWRERLRYRLRTRGRGLACGDRAVGGRPKRVISSYVMPSRRILQLGDPLLRAVSAPVSTPSEATPTFEDLRATLHEFRRTHGFGRGISAVQIGQPLRLIYIEFEGATYAIRNPEYEFQIGRAH